MTRCVVCRRRLPDRARLDPRRLSSLYCGRRCQDRDLQAEALRRRAISELRPR